MHKWGIKSRCSDVLEHYQCQLCPFATYFHVEIREHRKICNLQIFSSGNPILEKDVCSMSLESYQCKDCEFTTLFRVDLRKHNCKFITFDVDQYDEYIEKNGVIMLREDWEKAEKYYCPHCNYYSNVKRYLNQHKLRKHRKRLKCSKCSYRTDRKMCLKQHEMKQHGVHHKSVKWFKCKLCSYQTVYKGDLNSHLKNRHSTDNIELFQCECCQYETKYKSNLSQHKHNKHTENGATHFRTKPKDYLNLHVERKRGEQKQFKCSQCHFTTTNQHYAKGHEKRRHSPEDQTHEKKSHAPKDQIKWHQCQHCGYRTKSTTNLKVHINRKHHAVDD